MSWILQREKHYADGEAFYLIGSDLVETTEAKDVVLIIPPDKVYEQVGGGVTVVACQPGNKKYPRCFDCGGQLAWAENGGVPGSRKCIKCGSRYADMRYHA